MDSTTYTDRLLKRLTLNTDQTLVIKLWQLSSGDLERIVEALGRTKKNSNTSVQKLVLHVREFYENRHEYYHELLNDIIANRPQLRTLELRCRDSEQRPHVLSALIKDPFLLAAAKSPSIRHVILNHTAISQGALTHLLSQNAHLTTLKLKNCSVVPSSHTADDAGPDHDTYDEPIIAHCSLQKLVLEGRVLEGVFSVLNKVQSFDALDSLTVAISDGSNHHHHHHQNHDPVALLQTTLVSRGIQHLLDASHRPCQSLHLQGFHFANEQSLHPILQALQRRSTATTDKPLSSLSFSNCVFGPAATTLLSTNNLPTRSLELVHSTTAGKTVGEIVATTLPSPKSPKHEDPERRHLLSDLRLSVRSVAELKTVLALLETPNTSLKCVHLLFRDMCTHSRNKTVVVQQLASSLPKWKSVKEVNMDRLPKTGQESTALLLGAFEKNESLERVEITGGTLLTTSMNKSSKALNYDAKKRLQYYGQRNKGLKRLLDPRAADSSVIPDSVWANLLHTTQTIGPDLMYRTLIHPKVLAFIKTV